MRHQKKKIALKPKNSTRKAMIVNLAESLILHEKVKTTKTRAKAVKSFLEKLITVAKKNTLAGRRELIKRLYTKNAVRKMMEVIGPRYVDRKGGYTRVTVISGNRVGDASEEAIVELIK